MATTYTPEQIYGTQPQVPLPTQTAPGAIAGNIGTLGSLYGLSTGTGAASGAGAAAQYNTLLPGLSELMGTASGNVQQELSGDLPADVMAQIQQAGAERGVQTGMPGSPASEAAMLKALGLTSLGLEEQGQTDLGKLIGETPTGPAFNPASMQTSPAAQQSAAAANSIYASAPVPAAAGAANMGATLGGLGAGLGAGRAPSGAALPTAGTGTNPFYGGVGQPGGTSTGTGTSLGDLYGLTGNTQGGLAPEDMFDLGGNMAASPGGGSYYFGANPADQFSPEEIDASIFGGGE
ncbi:MAG TPA: hypothetical protein VMQ76_13690 [Terracidiphilus sp.]|nr:hypothetical protein [Terracidiphilus sp.]